MHERIKAGAATLSFRLVVRPDAYSTLAMNLFRGPNATGLTPRLCATTLPLFAFSCVSLDAQQPPWRRPR
jgi:hypothetical protein